MTLVRAAILESNGAHKICQVYDYVNKNAPRFREALCVLRVPIYSVTSFHATRKFLTENREVVVVMVMEK
ncbi:MAG: hypothetical protein L0287_37135 [Anaerolineae bacterium]|nr:hypothetical protein [Anaerolineae bacterium]